MRKWAKQSYGLFRAPPPQPPHSFGKNEKCRKKKTTYELEYVCVFSPVHFWPPPHTQTGKKSNAYAKFLMDGLPNLRLSDSLKIFKLQKVKIFPRKVWRQADNGNEGMKRFHFLWIPTIIPFCQKLKKSEQHDKVSLEFFQYKGAQFPDIKVPSSWEGVSIFCFWFSGFVFYPAKSIVKVGWENSSSTWTLLSSRTDLLPEIPLKVSTIRTNHTTHTAFLLSCFFDALQGKPQSWIELPSLVLFSFLENISVLVVNKIDGHNRKVSLSQSGEIKKRHFIHNATLCKTSLI